MRKWLLITLAAVAAVAVVVGGALVFTHHDRGPSTGHGGPGDSEFNIEGPRPDNADAVTAAQAALSAMLSWTPATDAGPGEGLVRAKPWLTGQLLEAANGTPATGVRPLPEWAGWKAAGDVVTATVTNARVSGPIQNRECLVLATVTQNVLHTNSAPTLYKVMTVSVAMTNTANGWRMSTWRLVS